MNFKRELKKIGITESYAGLGMVDGTPAAILRWNGREEYVTALNLDPDYLPKKYAWIIETFSDAAHALEHTRPTPR